MKGDEDPTEGTPSKTPRTPSKKTPAKKAGKKRGHDSDSDEVEMTDNDDDEHETNGVEALDSGADVGGSPHPPPRKRLQRKVQTPEKRAEMGEYIKREFMGSGDEGDAGDASDESEFHPRAVE